MDNEKKWMLMTYYCPTHGDSGLVNPIELTKKEISQTFMQRGSALKIKNPEHTLSLQKRL